MHTILEQVDSFRDYVRHQIANGGGRLTIDELYDRWRAGSELDETICAIQQSRAEFQAGRSHSLEEADAEIRRELGFAPPAR